MRLSESSPLPEARRSARSRWLWRCLGVLLFGTGCPQLLDDDFAERGSLLTDPGGAGGRTGSAASGGSGLGGDSAGGAAGTSGAGGGGSGGWGTGVSGGSGGSGGTDVVAEPRNCPFSEPEALVGLDFASGSEWGASVTADGLTLLFSQETAGNADLYRATRPDRRVTFSAPVALSELNTGDDEGTPLSSADGLRLYFYSNRPGGPGGRDLYVATRSDLASEFANAQLLANVNSPQSDHLPRLSSDELTLWFTSAREGGAGGSDLWTATRSSIDAPFGTPTPFNAVNGSSGDESGALTQDGLVLVFDSTRDGVGNSEIFMTTRTNVSESFPSPTALSSVNSTANEYNVFLTPDEREIFFSSNRNSGAEHHLFRSLRSCE